MRGVTAAHRVAPFRDHLLGSMHADERWTCPQCDPELDILDMEPPSRKARAIQAKEEKDGQAKPKVRNTQLYCRYLSTMNSWLGGQSLVRIRNGEHRAFSRVGVIVTFRARVSRMYRLSNTDYGSATGQRSAGNWISELHVVLEALVVRERLSPNWYNVSRRKGQQVRRQALVVQYGRSCYSLLLVTWFW